MTRASLSLISAWREFLKGAVAVHPDVVLAAVALKSPTEFAQPALQLSTLHSGNVHSYVYERNIRNFPTAVRRFRWTPSARNDWRGAAAGDPLLAEGRLTQGVTETALERRAIENALREEGGVQYRAARRLGISERTLRYKLEKHRMATGDRSPAGQVSHFNIETQSHGRVKTISRAVHSNVEM